MVLLPPELSPNGSDPQYDKAPCGHHSLDPQGYFLRINTTELAWLGYRAEEVVGKLRFVDLCTEESRATFDVQYPMLLEKGEIKDVEFSLRRKDGSVLDVSVSSVAEYDAGGAYLCSDTIVFDLTELRRIEGCRLAREKVEAANRAKTECLARVSHEMRSPLASILGYVEMMYDARQSTPERLQCLGRMRKEVGRLTHIIDDILELSRIEAGRLEVSARSFLLLPFLSEIVQGLQSRAWKKNLTVRCFASGEVPERICTDAQRLRQVLLDVAGNALRYTSRGEIGLVPSMQGKLLQIRISDTGCGVPQEQREAIFEPFVHFAVPDYDRGGAVESGSGLGLALARNIARALGGDVKLLGSGVGEGSHFAVTIDPGSLEGVAWLPPFREEDLRAVGTEPAPLKLQRLDGVRVLLVDDCPDIQHIVAHFLRKCGAEIDVARDGLEGVRKALARPFDCVLLDMQMPKLDGHQVLERLLGEGIRTPVIALTADARHGRREECLEAGYADYLTKPISAVTLTQTLRRHCLPA